MEKTTYTVKEAARESGRTEQEIRDAIRSGLLVAELSHNIGDYLIRAEEFSRFVKLGGGEARLPERHRILIVDDEVNFSNVLKLELERDPRLVVRYASWGRDGVRTAKEFRPDLCLIDFMLPDVTGEEVLKSIRALQDTHATKVIVYSAHTREAIEQHPDLEDRLRKLGADEFMSKSSGLRAMIIKVYGMLGLETTTKIMRKPGTF